MRSASLDPGVHDRSSLSNARPGPDVGPGSVAWHLLEVAMRSRLTTLTTAIAFVVALGACAERSMTPLTGPQFDVSGEDAQLAGQVLAFASDRRGFFNIFMTKGSSSQPTQLTAVPGYNGRPNWSHDGRKIAFTACRENDASCEVYVMNADGSEQRRLTNNYAVDHMSVWSTNDQEIAFVSDRDGNWEIYVMNADGSNQTRLTNTAASEFFPSWSPDGSKMAFQSDRDGNEEVYVMNADGSGAVNVSQNPAHDNFPMWSPRGDKIAFRSDRDGNGEIYVMNADGAFPVRLTNTAGEEYGPAWSPSGNRIAFTSDRDGNFEIYTMKADGSLKTRVTSDPAWDADPAWAITGPGGRCVPPASAFVSWWPGIEQPFTQQLLLAERFDALDLSDWSLFGGGVVEIQDGKVLVQSSTSGASQSTGLVLGQLSDGDFDVVVDFSDFEVFAPGSPLNFGALSLLVYSHPPSPPNEIVLERSFGNGSNAIDGAVGPAGNRGRFAATYTETFGQLRVVRVGATVTLQFRSSPAASFTTLGTASWETGPVQFVIHARNDGYGTGVRGKFDNLTVNATAADAIDMIGGNTGKFRGGSFALGNVGHAFSLSNSVITLGSQPYLFQGFTIEGWVKFDGNNFDATQEIFNNNQLFLRKNDVFEGNTFGVFVNLADGSVEPRANSQMSLIPGVFYHVAATWDSEILSLYVNGQLEGASTRRAPLTPKTVTAEIGQGEQTSLEGNSFFGLIDELAISNRALTACEIRNVMNAGVDVGATDNVEK